MTISIFFITTVRLKSRINSADYHHKPILLCKFNNLVDIKGWNTNEKELDLKVRIELYKLREYGVVKFFPLKKKDTYSIRATDRANELLLFLNSLFQSGHFHSDFKNNFYHSRIRQKNEDYQIEIN